MREEQKSDQVITIKKKNEAGSELSILLLQNASFIAKLRLPIKFGP